MADTDRIIALTNLSVQCTDAGEIDAALAHSRLAFDLISAADFDLSLSVAVLHNWGYALKTAQRWSAALHAFTSAARLLEKPAALSPVDVATMLKEMAELLGWMEQPRDAFPLAYRCMNLRNEALGTVDPLVGEAAQLAGRLLVQIGDQPKAVTYLRPAYQIFHASLGLADGRTVEALLELLSAAWKAGETNVEEDLRKLIPIARSLGERGNPVYFRELVDLGGVLHARGAVDEARPLALEAAGLLADLDPDGDRRRAQSYLDLAALLSRLGEPKAALPLMSRAFRVSDPLIDQAVATRDRFYRRRYLSRLSDETDRIVRHAVDHADGDPAAAAEALYFVVNRKGLHAESGMAQDDARLAARQPDLAPLLQQIRDLDQQLLALQSAGMVDGARKMFQQKDRLTDRLRELNGEIEMRVATDAMPRARVAGRVQIAALAAALPAGSALIEFYAIQAPPSADDDAARRVLESSGDDEWLLPPRGVERYVAFVVRAGDERVRAIDLGAAAPLERLAYSYLVAMSGGRRDLIPKERQGDLLELSEEALSREVRRQFFDPLTGALGDCSTLFMAPDTVVCRVPFAALLEDEPSERRLLDRFAIGYVATGRGILDFDRAPAPPGEAPVVIGDPDYDFDKPGETSVPPPVVEGFPDFYFERLPGTADEAWRVAQMVGGRRLTGKKAHEAALHACRSPAILHVASHGYYIRPFAQGVYIIGNWRELGPLFRGEALGFASNAFLRSGIALAGVNAWSANRAVPEEVGDGLLTSAEVAHLELEGTELVVLSACSTALGDVTAGNGVSGLLYGFHVAGARATVAALWRIPDEITGRLMQSFYHGLLQGVPRIEALRQAQQELSATVPPWQWGSYVSYGDPGPIDYRPATGTTGSG